MTTSASPDATTHALAKGSVSGAIAARIRQARKERRWNTADLAARTGGRISGDVIQNIEHGRTHGGQRTRLVTIDELVTLAEALSMPPAALMPELGSVGERGIRLETVRLIDDLIRQLKDLRDRCAATAGRP